ncbi:competence type IV pilus minor pilin ComGF [Virgibacillus doumboii]|uniref:competence type IV pilus minor pilin ComGF n=1 Tax=Virgibacillus doumboii TaxID=2697503 RepID=UPI0013E08833|nr:ComGF family competence protein [Virgibacillus doumboii]
MLKGKTNRSVYLASRINDNGFTFLTVLVAIVILFMTLPFTAYLLKGVNITSSYEELSMQQFYYFLRDDVIKSTSYTVEPTKITLSHYDGTTVTIEQYENLIRRQVTNEGHEIYLRNIDKVKFTPSPYGFHVFITSKQGEQFEKTITFYQ